MMKFHKLLTVASILILGTGVALIIPFGFSWLQQREALAAPVAAEQPIVPQVQASSAVSKRPDAIEGTPTRIKVPSLGIDVTVMDGYYDAHTGQWTLSEDSAFYATPTSLINSSEGNTLIYGHNSERIFGKLLKIQDGAKATVTTDNGYEFMYVYESTEAVRPTDTHPLAYTSKPRLTLQTCSGLWHETRQMFYFSLKKYRKV